MHSVGIEAMNVFGGTACIDVGELAAHRELDESRFENLLMHEKSVALPHEDPVTFGVNAAKPIVDALSPEEKDRIEMLITCTESGIDFGKSVSTYIHHYLGLNRNCRLFELKQACYSGTAGFQLAVGFILANTSPGAKVLVVTTDIARFILKEGESPKHKDWSFAEPSTGAGAVAMLISNKADIFQIDVGANGYYGYEVMDTCRPNTESEAGDGDLSLLSYLDCCENAYQEYCRRVPEADYKNTFNYLSFHTPFGGMVKGAHRKMMRKTVKAMPDEIELDFTKRVSPGLAYCQRVGNIMGGTVFLSLASTIDNIDQEHAIRVGCFSYGSGCCSEFYSGIVTPQGKAKLQSIELSRHLDRRYKLSMAEYDKLLTSSDKIRFGTRDVNMDLEKASSYMTQHDGGGLLCLEKIDNYHREYQWIS